MWKLIRYFKLGLTGFLVTSTFAVTAIAETPPQVQGASDNMATARTPDLNQSLKLLSDADVDRYQRIFELQKAGNWKAADKLVDQLENNILIGHVLYQRYMHPTAWRSSYAELSGWMVAYPDLPAADDIYSLATKRRIENAEPLLPPVSDTRPSIAIQKPDPPLIIPEDIEPATGSSISYAKRREAARARSQIYSYLKRGRPSLAEKKIWTLESGDVLSKAEFARTLANIAASYYFVGEDEKALSLANVSAPQLRRYSSHADWIAGLASWRMGKVAEAAQHFEVVASDKSASRWTLSAGAFWAARAYLASHQPDKVNDLLRQASSHSRTFYGLIAARQLGQNVDLSWDLPPLTYDQLVPLLDITGVHRSIALAQIGRSDMADLEMRLIWQRYAPDMHESLLGLAAKLNLPSTQVKMAKALADDTSPTLDSALYPMPDWQPRGGYSLDKTLIFAFMRQESEFNPQARSGAGAMGLMQLMPNTASYIGRDRSLRNPRNRKLYEPDFNMQLGQRYIEYLLEKDVSEGNLFLVASAYNGGPGNVSKWVRNNHFKDDPLLYIESIPLDETRDFVARVISNLWIYQMRVGHPTPTLDDVAAGGWPMYTSLDAISKNERHGPDFEEATHARN